jgi:hypothetical protein
LRRRAAAAPAPVALAGAPEPAVVLPRAPVSAPAESAPPAVEAAQHVVRLAYTPPPPPAPLWTGPAANLATELNRDLVAPGDLLARPVRTRDQEPVAVPARPAEAATSAPPPEEVTPLAMPLAAPARPATTPDAVSRAADLPVAAHPGLFSRLVDRVTSALPLPEPIRHALESLTARPTEVPSAPPAESAAVPPEAPPSAPAAVDSAQAAPATAPVESGVPLSAGPGGAPAAPLVASMAAPAPVPAPLEESHPAPATGGILIAIVNRLLGGTPEPPAPTAGPAPLDMPWARRTAPPAVESDTVAEIEAVPAPGAPPAAVTAVSAPLAAPPAPVTESGTPTPIPLMVAAVDSPQAPPAPTAVDSLQPVPAPVESGVPLLAGSVAAPAETPADLPAAPVAVVPEPVLVPATAAPLVEPRTARGAGGILSAIVSRLLGGTAEPPAPATGPAPLAMPWARRATPPAAEPDIAADFETAPITIQRAAAAPVAPPVAAADAPAPSTAAPAPGAESGPSVAMPAIPAPGDQPGAPEAPAWVSTPTLAFDQTAGEIGEAQIGPPWMDIDTMADVLARVQTPLVPTTPLSAGQVGLWSRIWGAFERALPGGGTSRFERAASPAPPLAYAWSAGSPTTAGATGEPSVPSLPAGYSGQPGVIFGPSAVYGPTAAAWAPAGGRAPLAGRSLADFVPALGNRPFAPADSAPAPASYFDAESGAEADAGVTDPAQAWIAALDHLYGAPAAGSETMPLAVPYGGFVVPAAGASGVLPQDMVWVAETIGFASAPPAATPARQVWERPAAGPPSPVNWAGAQGPGAMPALPASAAPAWIGDTGSDEYDSEAVAWADVVAAAVDSDFGAGMPALALAGEEQGVPAVQQPAPGESQEAAGDAAGDLDELANSVYEIIRRRLEVERERDWA